MVFELFKEYSTVETFEGRPILGQNENPAKNEKLEKLLEDTNNLINQLSNNGVENQEANDKLVELKNNVNNVMLRVENEDLTEEELEEKVSFFESVMEKIKDILRRLGILSDDDEVVSNDNGEAEAEAEDDAADDEGDDQEGDDQEGDDSAFDESDDIEGFANQMGHVNGMTGMKKVLSLDLLLRSVLYACLFYLLAHPDTFKFVGKVLKRLSKSNLLYVHMLVFAVLYYLLNLFI